jgi:hypothetical protein
MAYLALVFTNCMTDFEAFANYTNFVINSDILRSFYSYNIQAIQIYYRIIEHFLDKNSKAMLIKMQEFGVYLDIIVMENVGTFFAKCATVEFIR